MSTKVFYLPIYKTGQLVIYNSKEYLIDMVYISGDKILIKLDAIIELIDSEKIIVKELTRFEI